MIRGLRKNLSARIAKAKEAQDAQGQKSTTPRRSFAQALRGLPEKIRNIGQSAAADKAQEAPARLGLPRRPFGRKAVSGAIKTAAEKMKEDKLVGMKKGGMADKSGRAMKRKTADTKGRAMKKGK